MSSILSNYIQKQYMSEEDANKHIENAKESYSFGIRDINVDVYKCPLHSNEVLLRINGFGHKLHLLYWFPQDVIIVVGAADFAEEVFSDFIKFVMMEREEDNQTIH